MIILLPGAIRISFFSDLGERLIKLFSETALNLFKICKNYNWCLLFACAFTRLKYVGYVLIQLYIFWYLFYPFTTAKNQLSPILPQMYRFS